MSDQIIARPELTAEYLRELLHYDPETGIFTSKDRRSWNFGRRSGAITTKGYRVLKVAGTSYTAARLAWLYTTGKWPERKLEHTDGDKSNDRIANLRLAFNVRNVARQVRDMTAQELQEWFSYDPESGAIVWARAPSSTIYRGTEAGTLDAATGYRSVGFGGKSIKEHRLAWLLYYGKWPTLLIDHINQVKSDNRIVNLREVTNSENLQNRGCVRGKSTPKGVSLNQQGSSLYAIAGLRIGSKRFAKAFKVVNGDVASAVGLAEQTYKMWQMEHHTHAPV